jgi:hypothetical protein
MMVSCATGVGTYEIKQAVLGYLLENPREPDKNAAGGD